MKETITIALKQEDVNTDPDLWRLKTRMTVTETLDQLSITQGQVNTAALERKRPKKGNGFGSGDDKPWLCPYPF